MTPRNEESKQEEGPETGNAYAAGEIVPLEESDVEVPNTVNAGEQDNAGDAGQEVGVDDDAKDAPVERVSADAPWIERYIDVLKTFWPLGLISFGGPQAHVAILREHLVSGQKAFL